MGSGTSKHATTNQNDCSLKEQGSPHCMLAAWWQDCQDKVRKIVFKKSKDELERARTCRKGEIAQDYTRLIQQVHDQREPRTEIKIGLPPWCSAGLVVLHNTLFILYAADHNCLILIFFVSNKHADTNTTVSHFQKHLPAVIVHLRQSGFMIMIIPNLLML